MSLQAATHITRGMFSYVACWLVKSCCICAHVATMSYCALMYYWHAVWQSHAVICVFPRMRSCCLPACCLAVFSHAVWQSSRMLSGSLLGCLAVCSHAFDSLASSLCRNLIRPRRKSRCTPDSCFTVSYWYLHASQRCFYGFLHCGEKVRLTFI